MGDLTPSSPSVLAFVEKASNELKIKLPQPHRVLAFGDQPDMQNELLDLVLHDDKRGTTIWPVPNPRYWDVGDLSVVLNGQGLPVCIFRTTELREMKFGEVDEQFAYDEAEGDRSWKMWHEVHVTYYDRKAKEAGMIFGDGSLVLCERFDLLYPPDQRSR